MKKRHIIISRWIQPNDDGVWVCENCGGGKHLWDKSMNMPQLVQCPGCMCIMINKEVVERG